jgi:adenylyltransferase/sulfurtransferase
MQTATENISLKSPVKSPVKSADPRHHLTHYIGNTPLIELINISKSFTPVKIYAKAELILLANLEVNLHHLKRDEEIVVMCRSGIRSAQAVKFLREAGFQKVKNLTGGILAWADEIDPSIVK